MVVGSVLGVRLILRFMVRVRVGHSLHFYPKVPFTYYI